MSDQNDLLIFALKKALMAILPELMDLSKRDPLIVNRKEIARLLSCSESQIRIYVQEGMPTIKRKDGTLSRYEPGACLEWLKKN